MLKCRYVYYAGCPHPDPDHPDIALSQHLGPELADSTASAKRAADKQGRYHRAVRKTALFCFILQLDQHQILFLT